MRWVGAALATVCATLVMGYGAIADDDAAGAVPPADAETVKAYAGAWMISDESGSNTCQITLEAQEAIGGYALEVAPACAETFAVTGELASWRIFEDGAIVFADATRKERLRFTTPDDSYVAVEEVDGIARLFPVEK